MGGLNVFFDSYYFLLVVPAMIFAFWAQARVNSTFRRYSQQAVRSGMTGADAAEAVLRLNGVTGVRIERIDGELTDHYDPRDNVIRLSRPVCDVSSVAAVGVAAHEAGHAVQYAVGYGPIKLRTAIIPVTKFGSALSMPLVIAGLIFSYEPLFMAGIIFFCAALFFQLVTLPVEYNASERAVAALAESGALTDDELPGARSTLSAAALTYVAALAVSLMQLLRLLLLFGGNSRRRD
jgi:Zn-dependent membrane protease YugP